MSDMDNKLTRIGVFYDGNYFSHVSSYYTYHHERRARLSIGGLHHFIRAEVAKHEAVDARYCQIVDAHYFRGRLSASEAEQRNSLRADRAFDDVLTREGVVTHYLPVTPTGEKGIDVGSLLRSWSSRSTSVSTSVCSSLVTATSFPSSGS